MSQQKGRITGNDTPSKKLSFTFGPYSDKINKQLLLNAVHDLINRQTLLLNQMANHHTMLS